MKTITVFNIRATNWRINNRDFFVSENVEWSNSDNESAMDFDSRESASNWMNNSNLTVVDGHPIEWVIEELLADL